MEVDRWIGQGEDRCGHGSCIMGLVGDRDGDGWVFLGFSRGGLWSLRLVWVLDLCLQVWL